MEDPDALLSEFEASYAAAMAPLYSMTGKEPRETPKQISENLDRSINRFTTAARKLENFFLQRRFMLGLTRPELVLRDEDLELRAEIVRKDELLKKHQEKLVQWQHLLMQDVTPSQHQQQQVQQQHQPQQLPQQLRPQHFPLRPPPPNIPLPQVPLATSGFVAGNNSANFRGMAPNRMMQ